MPRIVLIDDEPVLRLTFRHILEQDGHEVLDATNGREGVDLCRQVHPDLVITDLMMPGQAGTKTVEILHDEFPRMPISAMSGAGLEYSDEYHPDPDTFCYVAKPVDKPALLKLVGFMLDNQHAHKRGESTAQARDEPSDSMQSRITKNPK